MSLRFLWALGQPAIAAPTLRSRCVPLPYGLFAAVTAPGPVNRAHRADELAKEAHAILNAGASRFGQFTAEDAVYRAP